MRTIWSGVEKRRPGAAAGQKAGCYCEPGTDGGGRAGVARHAGDLDVLRARLDHFRERTHCQLQRPLHVPRPLLAVVLLQVFANRLRAASDRVRLTTERSGTTDCWSI